MALSLEQEDVITSIASGDSLFLTGPGGTGKSHLIHSLRAKFPTKNIAITAMTGCAALLIGDGAKTLHSWAGIGLGKGTVEATVTTIKKVSPLSKRWRQTDILVIDEVSMLTPELLELLNEIAKRLRKSERPMGGMQVVLVGDFLQLPPVAKGSVIRFAFESPAWPQIIKKTFHLKRIFRQQDSSFQKILDEARMGDLSSESLITLKARLNLSYEHELIQPTMLFTRKMDVDQINKAHLDALEGTAYSFSVRTPPVLGHPALEIQRTVEKMDKDANYVTELILKVGAQVMLLKNIDQEKGLVNGSRGVVTGFKDDPAHYPIVLFKNQEQRVISPELWGSDHEPPIHREQIPLRLAYALTIHKAQGATLDCAVIDIGPSTFEYGQAYVALSRVKSLDCLYIHDVAPSAFRAHPTVKKFYNGSYTMPVAPAVPATPVAPIPVAPLSEPKEKKKKGITAKSGYSFADDIEVPVQVQKTLTGWLS
jgi:ATP-dependent DNA helicase PIF1